jgi:thiol-disulfide isomerase/thioredoxin
MKYIFIIMTVLTWPVKNGLAQMPKDGHFSLAGRITGRNGDKLRLYYLDKFGTRTVDTAVIVDESFRFSGLVAGSTYATLEGNTRSRSVDDPQRVEMFLDAGELRLTLAPQNFKEFNLIGSYVQAQWDSLKLLQGPLLEQRKIFDDQYDNLKKEFASIRDSIQKQTLLKKEEVIVAMLLPYEDALRKIERDFIIKHCESIISPFLLLNGYNADLRSDSLAAIYDLFSLKVKSSIYGIRVAEEIKKLRNNQLGKKAPSFTIINLNGEVFNLQKHRANKFILLEFWASWCIPCRHGIPALKSLVNKNFTVPLEIVAISFDTDKLAWQNAIKEDNTGNWQHLLSVTTSGNSKRKTLDFRNLFEVPYIPYKILIDPAGIIAGIYGVGPENDKRLTQDLDRLLR